MPSDADNPGDPVTAKLCKAYRETQDEKINGLKRTIYVSSLAMTTIIVITQYLLSIN